MSRSTSGPPWTTSAGVPLLTLHTIDPKGWQFAVKHALDRSAALLGLLILSPVLARHRRSPSS